MIQRFKGMMMPLVLISIISGVFLGGAYIHPALKAFFYTLSLNLKELLIFILPFMIVTFVFRSLLKLGKNAYKLILLLIPCIILSNFCSTFAAYMMGGKWLAASCFNCKLAASNAGIQPLWSFRLPQLLSNDMALLMGITGSLACILKPSENVERISGKAMDCLEFFLNRVFVPIIPVFIFGFVLNLEESGVLSFIVQEYMPVLLSVVIFCYGYIFILYGIGSTFRVREWGSSIQNMLPAALTGLSTMSSAAALPLTLSGASRNIRDNNIAKAVVPSTVNVHLVGDCFAITIFALALMVSFDMGIPDTKTFLIFAFYFVIAKFAVAAVPGGGILVMLPILEKHLGFSPAMLSLITALYLLFDPIITSANVIGNGAFAQLFALAYNRLHSVRP